MEWQAARYSRALGFENAHGLISTRQGIILRRRDSMECDWSYGEASPLEPHSSDTLEQCWNWLLSPNRDQSKAPPAIRFSVDSLDNWQKIIEEKSRKLKSNALLDLSANKDDVNRVLSDGFRIIKFKVAPKNFAKSLDLMRYALSVCPSIRFRLDANCSMNGIELFDVIKEISGLPIDYFEDPTGELTNEVLETFHRADIAVALDQADGAKADVLILKPTTVGSFAKLKEKLKEQKAAGGRAVITSCLESEVGQAAVAWLASELLPEETHGVAFPKGETNWINSLDWQGLA